MTITDKRSVGPYHAHETEVIRKPVLLRAGAPFSAVMNKERCR
jgi:hypothetical protein